MKKIILALSSILIFGLACKKEVQQQIVQKQTNKNSKARLNSIQYYNLGTDILESDFLGNDHDAEDAKFNEVEYPIVLSLLELNKNSNLMQNLVEKLNSSHEKEYSLLTFSEEFPEINEIINAKFASRISNFSEYGNNWKNYIKQNYKYKSDLYVPVIMLLNRGSIDINKEKYIAGGYIINEEKFPQFDDNIPMWMNSENFSLITTLNENQAYNIDEPILTVGNKIAPIDVNGGGGGTGGTGGTDESDIEDDPESTSWPTASHQKCNVSTHVHEAININKFKLNQRFESSGSSDFNFIWAANARYEPSTSSFLAGTSATAVGERWQEKINKNDINNGNYITWNRTFFHPDMFQSPYCFEISNMPTNFNSFYVVGAYERDWYRPRYKIITYSVYKSASNSYGTYTKKGRRKFPNDVYFIDHTNNNSYPFGTRNPSPNTTFYGNINGEVQLLRWSL